MGSWFVGNNRTRLPLSRGLAGSGGSTPALSASLLSSASSPVTTISIPRSASSRSSGGSSESTSGGTRHLPLVGEARLDGGSADLISARNLGLLDTSRVLVLLSFGIAVEVQISHDVPFGLAGSEGTAETEDLTGKHPPDETDGVAALVVGRDGNVDVLGGGIGVTEGLIDRISSHSGMRIMEAPTMTGMLT